MTNVQQHQGGWSLDFIILAAGNSSRLPEANKLLLPVSGIPLCVHAVQQALKASSVIGGNVIVVTGFESSLIQNTITAALEGEKVTFVENRNFLNGQFSSTKAGLEAITEGSPFFICLSDLPLITAAHYIKLVQYLAGFDAVRPFSGGRPGHPVLHASSLRSRILALPDTGSVREVLSGCKVNQYEDGDPAWVTDIDTISDYRALHC